MATEVTIVTMKDVVERHKLDVQAAHAAALEKLEAYVGNNKLEPKHAAHFFNNVRKKEGTAQQQVGECMCCGAHVVSTGSFKFHSHILGCVVMPALVKKPFHELRNSTASKRQAKHEADKMHEEEVQIAAAQHQAEQKRWKQQCIRAGIHSAEVEAADRAIANFFYGNALPFSAAGSEVDSLYHKMVKAIQAAPPSYVPPNYKKLGGDLLDKCYDSMWAKLKERDPIGEKAMKFGSTYVSDGWDSCDSLPLINSAFITENDGGLFWRSVDTSKNTKSAEYCAAQMIADIYAYGPLKVVMVVTDTCTTMQKCWEIVEDEFPWVSVVPCQPHVISLLMKDIAKTESVTKLISDESVIVQWFSNHHFPLAKLREVVRNKLGKAKELVKAGATRFGTNTLVGERLLELKACLQATVVDEEYAAQNYKDKGNTEEETAAGKLVRSNKGATTKSLILDDNGFWERTNTHVKTTMPIFKMLRRFDTGSPTIGKLYSSWFELGEHLKSVPSDYKAVAMEKHSERWAYGHAHIAGAAYVLDPEFINHEQESNAEVMQGFMNTVEKIAVLVEVRRQAEASDELAKQWEQRAMFIAANPLNQKAWDHFPDYPTVKDNAEVKDFCTKVNAQLSLYRGKKGMFAREWVIEAAEKIPAYMWWDNNGGSVPELQTVARLVLSQPASSSICERINGEFAFVKDKRRNRLQHAKATKLVGLFHNLRLMHTMKRLVYTEPCIGWNDEDLKVGIEKFGVAEYAAPTVKKINKPQRPDEISFEPHDVQLEQLELDEDEPVELLHLM